MPKYPLRPGEPCTLCQMNVAGPRDCGLVYLVMDGDRLRLELTERRPGSDCGTGCDPAESTSDP
jgi:hypothetical protein